MDTLTERDTQSVTLSAHLKLYCTNLRGPTDTQATLSVFLFVVSEVGLACRVASQAGDVLWAPYWRLTVRQTDYSPCTKIQLCSLDAALATLRNHFNTASPPRHLRSPCSLPILYSTGLSMTLMLALIVWASRLVWIFHRRKKL